MRPRNPAFARLTAYPFVRLEEAKSRARARGIRVIDFGVGDPQEKTPALVRDALIRELPESAGYPPAVGVPDLRAAIADWVRWRYAVTVDPDRHVLPSNGSKEAIYLLHQAVIDPGADRRTVLIPEPAYPVYEVGTLFAGGIPRAIPLLEGSRFLPDLDAIAPDIWRQTALLWLNYPHNPTGVVAEIDLYKRALDLAREHGFWVASDEAYSELWFDAPPPSALQAGLDGLIVLNTLSKRSAMTGYRSGMIVGDPELIRNLATVRPSQGIATPLFIQAAAIAAWRDEAHVAHQRELYRAKREILMQVLRKKGLRIVGSSATFYLWIGVPEEESSESFAMRLLEAGLVVTPGNYFGKHGEGYVRMALVPTCELCREAAMILERTL